MECETNTNRKGYVGKRKIPLLTKYINILLPYFEWIGSISNLRSVYIISTNKVLPDR